MLEKTIDRKVLFCLLLCFPAARHSCLAAEAGYFLPHSRPSISRLPAGETGKSRPLTTAPLLPGGKSIDLSIAAKAPPKAFAEPSMQSVLRRLGPISVERSQSSPVAMEHGITTVFALPVTGIPGLDLTASFFAGHRDTRLGAPPGSAAVTGGIRWRW